MSALPEVFKIAANAGGVYVEIGTLQKYCGCPLLLVAPSARAEHYISLAYNVPCHVFKSLHPLAYRFLAETGADPHYDATGLARIHVSTCSTALHGPAPCVDLYSLLGPSAAAQRIFNGTVQRPVAAAGVWWTLSSDPPGAERRSLAALTVQSVTAAVLTPASGNSPTNVQFSVDYVAVAAGLLVRETYALDAATASVDVTASVILAGSAPLGAWLKDVRSAAGASVAAAARIITLAPGARPEPPAPSQDVSAATFSSFGVSFLALQSDGANVTVLEVDADARSASVSLPRAGKQTFSLPPPLRAEERYMWNFNVSAPALTRNGFATVVDVAVVAVSALPTIRYTLTASDF